VGGWWRANLIGLGIGAVVFAGSAALAAQGLAPGEAAVFNAINGLPDVLYYAIWPFMQYGVFITIPVLIVVALLLRRFRLAAAMAIAGVGVYLLAKVVKEQVNRGRPEQLLPGVEERETFAEASLGYPSGHAAVAAALTVVVTPYLRGRWKIVPAAVLVVVCIGRMYVAAHTPLDLIGGASLGVCAGCVANLIVGPPRPTTRVGGDADRQVEAGGDGEAQPGAADHVEGVVGADVHPGEHDQADRDPGEQLPPPR
jgi:undecaprenyl-diphosphatase